jgi:helix-turn-helix protein
MLHQDNTQQPRVLDIPQVARIINRTELATRRAIERGQIPARRWGGRVVVLVDDLDKFLAALPLRPIGPRV